MSVARQNADFHPQGPTGNSRIWIARPEGQLGNRLFLSAHFLAFAAEYSCRLINPAFAEYARYFVGPERDPWGNFPPSHSPRPFPGFLRKNFPHLVDRVAELLARSQLHLPGCAVLDITRDHDLSDTDYPLDSPDFRQLLQTNHNLLVRGWKFRCHELVERHRSLIHQYFSPVPSIEAVVRSCVNLAREDGNFLLGVHLRQGDYQEWQGGKYYFSLNQYVDWMRQAAALHGDKRVRFLICSNSQFGPDDFAGLPVSFGPGDPVGDLYALAACDALMAPPSTFSLWASHYGKIPLHMLEEENQPVHPVSFTIHEIV